MADRTNIYVGKDLIGFIREICSQERIKNGTRICKEISEDLILSEDLKAILEDA